MDEEHVQAERLPLTVGIALLVSYPLLVVAATWPSPWLFLVATGGSYVAEWFLRTRSRYLFTILSHCNVGITLRYVARDLLVVVFLARSGEITGVPLVLVAGMLMSLHAIRGLYTALVIWLRLRRRLPVLTRGIDLSVLRIPDAPPELLRSGSVTYMLDIDVVVVAAVAVGAVSGSQVLALPAAVVAAGASLAVLALTSRQALAHRRFPSSSAVLSELRRQLARHDPEVVLYYSGTGDSLYQVNMWLRTIEALDQRALIVMRERINLPLVNPTATPIVCFTSAIDLMSFPLPSVRVALYVANVGKNIHLLRLPGVRHVFIGHGDSDKAASVNPFSKVYDEVWVAGQAGRDRYARAQVGVLDGDIVEVGRPQLAPILQRTTSEQDGAIRTVLYAPTWEGWDGDPHCFSLKIMGPLIVRRLLERDPYVRVLYKPHPLTGTRDPRARQAHQDIVALIESDNAARAAETAGDQLRMGPNRVPNRRMGRAGLLALQRRLVAVSDGLFQDEAQSARDSVPAQADRMAEKVRLLSEVHTSFWDSEAGVTHRILSGPVPSLYECFNQCDVLISDISSVVADFIQSQKPYIVTNPRGLPDQQFRDDYPTAKAAYLLGADCAALDSILAGLEGGDDALAERRRELQTYLLGPTEPASIARFRAAVTRLVRETERARGPYSTPGGWDLDAEPDLPMSVRVEAEVSDSGPVRVEDR